ncbi:MAG: hypothetical protein KTR16_02065 [Acidiferrobacterales bacterium]|nr:hypothetical protein [Acidiferrobacterales bacterium]
MPSPFDGMAVYKMTVYGYTVDAYGQSTYSVKGVIKCEYEQGGSMQRDENGTEFVPMSTFYPVESSIEIKRGDFVALGDTSSISDPVEAGGETVKKAPKYGHGYMGWGEETIVYTG